MDRVINVRDFSTTPGTRNSSEGAYSGKQFREEIEPEFKKALQENSKLTINLDNTIGYGAAWLEEVFGGLARKEGKENVSKVIDFISNEEPYLIDDIKGYIEDVEKNS